MNDNEKPVAKVRRGAVRIAIWAQDGKFGKFYTMTPSRRYKKDGTWNTSTSFPEDEALILSKAFSDAYDIIRQLRDLEDRDRPQESINV